MQLEFIGPALVSEDGGIEYLAKLDGKFLVCHFSYEAVEDIEPQTLDGDALAMFTKHQLKLLSIAEQKIRGGHAHDGTVQIFSGDIAG
jgi:hypothetical protein